MADHNSKSKALPERLVDLVLQRSTQGIDVHEQRELESFLANLPDRDQVEKEILRFELTAAAVDLSLSRVDHSMPQQLHQKILNDAKLHFNAMSSGPDAASPDSATSPAKSVIAPKPIVPATKPLLTRREAFGWLAAAASVTLLLTGWNPFAETPDSIVKEIVVERPIVEYAEAPTIPIEKELESFVGEEAPKDLVELSFIPLPLADGATGRVVWSDLAQEGFMILRGLRPNDPEVSQYQLWIFDTDREQKYPVDGGVFDIVEMEEIIAIDAKIKVDKAVRFAVTEEEPGGVVVSTRERLPLLADITTE